MKAPGRASNPQTFPEEKKKTMKLFESFLRVEEKTTTLGPSWRLNKADEKYMDPDLNVNYISTTRRYCNNGYIGRGVNSITG